MTEVEKITNELDAAEVAHATALARVRALREELAAAQAAASPTHEWAGKAVRALKQTWLGGREMVIKGTVTMQRDNSRPYRNYFPDPGEWFVLSASGKTAYRLTPLFSSDLKWELDK